MEEGTGIVAPPKKSLFGGSKKAASITKMAAGNIDVVDIASSLLRR